MAKNWQVIYRYQNSLAGCFVWAPDEAQAEKKFKARKEFDFDPAYDYPFLKKYDAGNEKALAKQIPLTADNIAIIDGIAKVIPITRRYRGPRIRGGFMRECHKQDAERVSIYAR